MASTFSIIDKDSGQVKYTGAPTYNGTYLKPSFLEFRDIASPVPIEWKVGDYVVYSRTGYTYRLYAIPALREQADYGLAGDAYVYEDVRFYTHAKELELCPFRDLVPDDNNIHFSTQPAISTYENVSGIAARLEECLNDIYPESWEVRVVSSEEEEDAEFMSMISEPRDFSVSGVTILGALDKIYEIWSECGWLYSEEDGKAVITIGAANLNEAKADSLVLENHAGLLGINQRISNEDSMATRLYVYGAARNLPANYYNGKPIKDAESVDIEHLMIPISEWGTTEVDGEEMPDARLAYIEDAAAKAKYGLLAKTIYFDGTSNDTPTIFPSLKGVTIGDIRAAMDYETSTRYYPSSRYSDTERVDVIKSVVNPADDGDTTTNGDQYISETLQVASQTNNITFSQLIDEHAVLLGSISPQLTDSATITLNFGEGTIRGERISGRLKPECKIFVTSAPYGGSSSGILAIYRCPATGSGYLQIRFTLPPNEIKATYSSISTIYFYAVFSTNGEYIDMPNPESEPIETTFTMFNSSFEIKLFETKKLDREFTIKLKQIGFNIQDRAMLGNGKSILMKTGNCAGRKFVIDSCKYNSSADEWTLKVWRSIDKSLKQYFPSSRFPIAANDEFVLLDIAMPEIYVTIGSQKLLAAGEDMLDYLSKPQITYEPRIDSKYIKTNSLSLIEGMYVTLYSYLAIEGGGYVTSIIDTITISENESSIPTYKFTLRDKKKKTWTESLSDSMESESESLREYQSESGTAEVDLSDYYTKEEIDAIAFTDPTDYWGKEELTPISASEVGDLIFTYFSYPSLFVTLEEKNGKTLLDKNGRTLMVRGYGAVSE